MFFVISKTLGVLAIPSNLFIVIGLVGIALLLTRYVVAGRRFVVASALLIAAIEFLPIGNILAAPLADRFPPWRAALWQPTGIIVLGGVIDSEISNTRGQFALNDAAERLTAAIMLAREYPNARVVFSGGNGELIGGHSEGEFAARFLETLGVPSNRVLVENQSRNTAENAIYTKRLIAPKMEEHWLLVTSAMHMPRAVGVFRQAGFPVVPYPVDFQTARRQNLWVRLISVPGGIRLTDSAVREWLGLCIYWITGRTEVLFPAPSFD